MLAYWNKNKPFQYPKMKNKQNSSVEIKGKKLAAFCRNCPIINARKRKRIEREGF